MRGIQSWHCDLQPEDRAVPSYREDLAVRSEQRGRDQWAAVPAPDEMVGSIEHFDVARPATAVVHERIAGGIDRHAARSVSARCEGVHLVPLRVDVQDPSVVVVGHDDPAVRVDARQVFVTEKVGVLRRETADTPHEIARPREHRHRPNLVVDDVNVAGTVCREVEWGLELSFSAAEAAELADEFPSRREDLDPLVPAIGHVDVTVRAYRDRCVNVGRVRGSSPSNLNWPGPLPNLPHRRSTFPPGEITTTCWLESVT